MNLRRQLLASAAVAFGVLGALVLVEIGLRVFSLAPSEGIFTVSEAEFQRVPGLFSPGQNIVDRRLSALPYAVRIDSLGYRGADFAMHKVPDELRILAIGDSFTYGDFVDDDQTAPAVLQMALARRCGRPVTVINAGVGGSTITTQAHMLRRAWVTTPDVVLLTFSENDVTDLRADMWKDLANNRRAKSRFPLSVVYPVLRRLALWHFALEERARLHVWRRESSVAERPQSVEDAETEALRRKYAQVFEVLAADVRSRGRTLVLVTFPSHLTVMGVTSEAQLEWVDALATKDSIPSLDLLQPFRAIGLPVDSLYLLPHDGHASPRGNALAGTWVAERLVELGVCGR